MNYALLLKAENPANNYVDEVSADSFTEAVDKLYHDMPEKLKKDFGIDDIVHNTIPIKDCEHDLVVHEI